MKKQTQKLTVTTTFPSTLAISPIMADKREDLPHPTVPTTATSEPDGIQMLILQEDYKKYISNKHGGESF